MFKAEGINYSKDENIMDEVMLDGEDDLGAALSAKERKLFWTVIFREKASGNPYKRRSLWKAY